MADRCHFLELPEELRLEIYEYLTPQTVIIWSYRSLDAETRISEAELAALHATSEGESAQNVFLAMPGRLLFSREAYPEILRACKLIHDEAVQLFFKPHTLELQPSYLPYVSSLTSREKTLVIDPARLRYTRSVPHLNVHLPLYEGEGYLEQLEVLAGSLHPQLHAAKSQRYCAGIDGGQI